MRRSTTALALALSLALTPHATAQQPTRQEQARVLFELGRELEQKGEHLAAARAFEEAYELDPQPLTLANAGEAWDGAGRRAEAANALETALTDPRFPEEARPEASAHRDRVSAGLGIVIAAGGIAFKVGASREREAGGRLFVEPGRHEVRCRDDAGEHVASVEVAAGAVARVSCERPVVTEAAPPRPPPAPASPPEEPGASGLWIGGWVMLGVAGAAGAVAVGVGAAFSSQRSDYEEGAVKTVADHDDLVTLRTVTNVAWFSAAGLAAVGVTLLIVDAVSDDEIPVARCGPGACIRF